jgi:hypothetical protein
MLGITKGSTREPARHAYVCEPSSVLKLMGRSPQKFFEKVNKTNNVLFGIPQIPTITVPRNSRFLVF